MINGQMEKSEDGILQNHTVSYEKSSFQGFYIDPFWKISLLDKISL